MSTAAVGEGPIDVLKIHSPEFQDLDAMQSRIGFPQANQPVTQPLSNVPVELQRSGLEIIDRLHQQCEPKTSVSPIRRMIENNYRIAKAAENHFFLRKDKEYEKKEKAESQVGELTSWKDWQGWTQAGGGFGSIFLALAAIVVPSIAPSLNLLRDLPMQTAQALSKWMDGQELPLQHDKDLFMSLTNSERQILEQLMQMPEKTQQLVMELMKKELQAFEAIGAQR